MTRQAPVDEFAIFSIGRFAVTNHHHAAACHAARSASPPSRARTTGQTGPAAQFESAGKAALAAGQHLSRATARRQPLWRWLLAGLLLAFSLGVTIVFIATVIVDVRQHHWAGALGASRAAVPAAVGWAALLIVFFASGTPAPEQVLAADEHTVAERQRQAALARDSIRRAQRRVQRLAASLAELSALAAQSGQDPQLARQVGDTAARLDQARQWLIGARAALAASQPDVAQTGGLQPDSARMPSPTAGRVA